MQSRFFCILYIRCECCVKLYSLCETNISYTKCKEAATDVTTSFVFFVPLS